MKRFIAEISVVAIAIRLVEERANASGGARISKGTVSSIGTGTLVPNAAANAYLATKSSASSVEWAASSHKAASFGLAREDAIIELCCLLCTFLNGCLS